MCTIVEWYFGFIKMFIKLYIYCFKQSLIKLYILVFVPNVDQYANLEVNTSTLTNCFRQVVK